MLVLYIWLAWYIVGMLGFVYWWTKDYDLTAGDIPNVLAAGLIGPVAFVVGYMVNVEESGKPPTVIMKKRQKKKSDM